MAQTLAGTRAILLRNPAAVWLRNALLPLAAVIGPFKRGILNGVRGLDTRAPPWLERTS